VVIVTMIVPALDFQSLEKIFHPSLPGINRGELKR